MQNKRVWSDALDDFIQFKITTKAMKEADNVGGIDNYILSLDNEAVEQSNYITKVRHQIASRLFHRGLLEDRVVKRLGYDKVPPVLEAEVSSK